MVFIQKGLIHLSFPQTDKPELAFLNCEILKGSKNVISAGSGSEGSNKAPFHIFYYLSLQS